MGRSSGAGNLFITVGGDVTPLKTAMTAGRSVLNEFGSAAIDVQAQVSKAFSDMASNAPAAAKQLEQSYAASFAQIRKNAEAALSAPNGGTAVDVINANATRQAAAAAEGQAAALRLVANAAIAADTAQNGLNAGVRAYAIAAEADAQQAESQAAALRMQAQSLGLVEAQLVAAGAAEQRFNVQQVAVGHGARTMNIAQMELMHVVRGSIDQFAAGASATQVLAMHMSMLGQAAALSGNSMGAFGRFMGGPYGLLLTAGISILGILISKHGEAKKSADDHKTAEETLTAYIHGEKIAADALLTSLKQLNDERSRGLDLTGEAIRREIDLVKATMDQAQANRAVIETQLTQAKIDLAAADREAARAASGGKGAIEAASGEQAAAQARVDSLQSSLQDLDKTIGYAEGTMADDITKLARDLSTHVGQANDLFDRQQAALEAKYRGTATYSKDASGKVITTLHGGLLNDPGMTDAKRQQILTQLTAEEQKLNVAREKAVAAARKLDEAEAGTTKATQTAADAFKAAVIGAEGTGPNRLGSSASGYGQFMPSTWLSYFNKAYPGQSGLSDAQKLGLRSNSEVAKGVIELATKDYEAVLKAAGQQITEASLYTVHLLGAGDAKKLLTAAPGASTSSFLSREVLNGNPFLKGTAEHARSAIATRIGDSGSAVSTGAAAIDQALKTEAEKALQQQATFDGERDQLNQHLLDALGKITGDYEQQAQSALTQVDAEHAAEATKIANNLAEGKYGDATSVAAQVRAAELQQLNDQLQEQKRSTILIQELNDQLQDEQKTADQAHQFRMDALNFEKDNARSSSERLQLDLEIIAATYEYKRQLLERNRQIAADNQQWTEVARIDGQIADLPAEQARDTRDAHKQDQSPLQAWKDQLPKTLAEVEDRLQQIEVTGLNQLEDDLASATAKALGLKGALGDVVSELVKLGFTLLESFAAGNNPLAGLFGGKRAMGGAVNDNQFYLVGENGPELFIPNGSGSIIPNHVLNAAASSWSVPRGLHTVPARQSQSGSDRGRTINQFWTVNTPNADSFRKSRGQMLREERRRA